MPEREAKAVFFCSAFNGILNGLPSASLMKLITQPPSSGLNEKLETADVNVRRFYIKSVIDGIEVDDGTIRIVGRKEVLQADRRPECQKRSSPRPRHRIRRSCTPGRPS